MAYIYKRGKYWWVGYKSSGRHVQKSLRVTSKAAAKTLLTEYQILEAREANQSKALILKKHFLDVYKEYLRFYSTMGQSHNTLREKQGAIARFLEYIQDRVIYISDITTQMVEEFYHKRIQKSLHGANKDLKVLKHLFNYAVDRGYLRNNPANGIRRAKPVKKIFRDLSFEEIEKLLTTAKEKFPNLYPIVAAAYYLGLRKMELVYLEWQDIDFANNVVYVRSKPENRIKDSEERTIPINRKLREILLSLPRRDRFVFLTPSGTTWKNNLYREFQKVVRETGLSNVNFQILRETFGSHLLRKGISVYLVSRYLGHSSVDVTTKHYAHIPVEQTHEEIDVL